MSGAVSPTSGSTGSSTTSGSNLLSSLTDNFQTFLTLLTTQLQNQDPTSPMDSSQFTTELVQFTGVEAQIDTNNSLSQLIQLTQGDTMVQAAQMLGKTVDVSSTQVPLQNGSGSIVFNTSTAEPVTIAVSSASGQQLYQTTINASEGNNSWTWNGQTSTGATMPDGLYTVTVNSAVSGTSAQAIPFSVQGTVTGLTTSSGSVDLEIGPLTVGVGSLTDVVN